MAQRIGNIMDWKLCHEEEVLGFPGDERLVCIEVNAPYEVGVFAKIDGEQRFVGRVSGRDRLEFTVPGDFELSVEGGELWYKTVDGQVVVHVEEAPVVFTRIANRKVRNHNLEMIEWKMKQNVAAFADQMVADAQMRIADTERRYAASRRPFQPPGTPDGGEPSSEGLQGQGRQPSSPPASKSREDEGKGGSDRKIDKGGRGSPTASDDR